MNYTTCILKTKYGVKFLSQLNYDREKKLKAKTVNNVIEACASFKITVKRLNSTSYIWPN